MNLYDLFLALAFLFYLPKILWKRKVPTFRQRFGLDIPNATDIIWIHAVSVGEVKSAKGLVEKIRQDYPNTFILVTTGTATGQEEAKRSIPADAYCFMPLDFRFIMRRWVQTLKPKALLFIESDIWYNLLQEAKVFGTKTALVSGKLSARSARRFNLIHPLAKKLFSHLDLILVQNEEHLQRFLPFATPQIGGNLKLDAKPLPVDPNLASRFPPNSILISCTHAPEESELLDVLQFIPGTIYLAPRHPHRYDEIIHLLNSKKITYSLWSNPRPTRVVLIDSMGLLPIFYTFCELAIVAGSFSSNVGGHNILEPCFYHCPVFFGPSIHNQKELASLVLSSNAGQQVTLTSLPSAIRAFRANPAPLRTGASLVTSQCTGALSRTYFSIKEKILENK